MKISKLFAIVAMFLASFSPLFFASVATADGPLWLRCAAADEKGDRVHLAFSNMMIGSVSMTGPAFIESLAAWDDSSDLDATAYDKIILNSGLHFGCEPRYENTTLESVRCEHKNSSDLDIRASYAEGINPSSTVVSKVYGRLTFGLERQKANDSYVVKVEIGSGSSERDDFAFTQTLTGLACESSNDN